MATGLSKEQARKRVYGQCRTIKRRLERAGVPVGYRRGQLFHSADAHGGFVVCFHRIDATNGETSLLCEIVVDGPDGWEEYDFLCAEQGLARIEQLFGANRLNGPSSEAASVVEQQPV